MIVDLSVSAISKTGPEMQAMWDNIQGNILTSHGRGHTSHIIFKFNDSNVDGAKDFIKNLAITTAHQQELDKADRNNSLFVGFYLTQKGYQYLGVNDTDVPSDFKSGTDRSMKAAGLSDPAVTEWEPGFSSDLHGMILVAWGNSTDNVTDQLNRDPLDAKTTAICDQLQYNGLAQVLAVEKGDGIKRHGTADDIEHFGYVDGISQPKFFIEDQTNHDNWDSMMPLNLVLTVDSPADNSFGSYFVFRKLEQNVKGFKTSEQTLADELTLTGDDRERAGAMVIGRYEDGTPITVQQADGLLASDQFNDFTYLQTADTTAAKCPYHAHIRKSNPRGETVSLGSTLDTEKKRMMARRGIIYGHRNKHPNDEPIVEMPEAGVGLMFMSFQSSLKDQFEFIQKSWVNNEKFLSGILSASTTAGSDPVIGQGAFTPGLQRYAKVWGAATTVSAAATPFHGFVTMKGGEYFFAPSISFINKL